MPVQFSHSVVSNSLKPHEPQHARPPCPSPTPGVHPNPCPLSRWCHPTISSSAIPFSSCLWSFPASGSFPMSQLFTSGSQSIGVSASTSVLPMNTQDWSPLGWTMCLLATCISSLKQISTQVFCPFFDWIFYIEFYELFICFGYKLLVGHIICKYFSTIWYLNGFLCYANCF